MGKKHKKVCRVLNFLINRLLQFLQLLDYVSISAFLYLVGIPIGITSSKIWLKSWVVTPGFKTYESIIKKDKKKHDKIKLIAYSKLSIEDLISKVLNYSNISHVRFILKNNVLKEFYDMKEEI